MMKLERCCKLKQLFQFRLRPPISNFLLDTSIKNFKTLKLDFLFVCFFAHILRFQSPFSNEMHRNHRCKCKPSHRFLSQVPNTFIPFFFLYFLFVSFFNPPKIDPSKRQYHPTGNSCCMVICEDEPSKHQKVSVKRISGACENSKGKGFSSFRS